MKKILLLTGILLSVPSMYSQQRDSIALDNTKPAQEGNLIKFLKKVTIGGVFQGRYVNSLTSGVDYEGNKFLVDEGKRTTSSGTFDIRRMRVSVKADITDKLSVNVLTNFAEFKSDTKNKVLENAFLGYNFNQYLKVRVGQFRPMVGPENFTAADVLKTLDFSNQYSGLGANGWGSFQVGADVSGKVDLGQVPMSYSVAVLNGNNRNKTDEDNGKHIFVRDAFRLSKKYALDLGLNGGWGRVKEKDVYMAAVDVTTNIPIANQWSLYLQGQAGQGINHTLYFKTPASKNQMSDYVMRGWFVLPNVRYEVGSPYLHSLEFSCRYEEWEENKLAENRRTTITPAVSFEFLKDYNLRLVVAMQMDRYQQELSKINNNILTAQLQARF